MVQKYNYILLEKIKEKVHIKFLNHRAGTKRVKRVRRMRRQDVRKISYVLFLI